MMAERRTCYPGGGGAWSGHTGNGEAWHKWQDRSSTGWYRTRKIKAGQWCGPWVRKRNDWRPVFLASIRGLGDRSKLDTEFVGFL